MTTYIILALCLIVILSYIFDITSKYSKIPGVILLIALGIGIQLAGKALKIEIPDLKPVLPVIGTLGLIMIIMEASLDLKLEKRKKVLIIKSISSAFVLLLLFSVVFTFISVHFFGYSLFDSIINSIPLGIISSSVAIPSASLLNPDDKEFVIYESSFSDIFGILAFDFIIISQSSLIRGVFTFALSSIITLVIAIITSSILALLLHKIRYHVNYVIIMTCVILVYVLAKLFHLPALLLVISFGLVLSNNQFLENTVARNFFNFEIFRSDLESFKKIMIELTFLVRSFFFIMFGFYAKVDGLLDWHNLITAFGITFVIFVTRFLFFRFILRLPAVPLLFFSPRGLITILLFISIPAASNILMIGEEVITLVILMTIFILMIGNIIYKRDHPIPGDSDPLLYNIP
jgi:cell volume regulation protein A